MPVILLSVDANTGGATAGIDRVVGSLNTMSGALDRTAVASNGLDAALARASATLDAQLAVWARAEGAMNTATDAATRFGGVLDGLGTKLAGMGGSFDAQVTGFGRVSDAADLATAAIGRQIDALGRLALANTVGGGAGATLGRTLPADLAAAESNRLGSAGRVLGGAAARDVGLGGTLASAALGPEGLLVGGGLYAAYKFAQAGASFQSAEMQTGS